MNIQQRRCRAPAHLHARTSLLTCCVPVLDKTEVVLSTVLTLIPSLSTTLAHLSPSQNLNMASQLAHIRKFLDNEMCHIWEISSGWVILCQTSFGHRMALQTFLLFSLVAEQVLCNFLSVSYILYL